jgi:hexosaminidase
LRDREAAVTDGGFSLVDVSMSLLLPRPARYETGEGEFTFDRNTRIAAENSVSDVATWLQGVLRPVTGLPLHEVGADGETDAALGPGAVVLAVNRDLGLEGFRLIVTSDGIRIEGGDRAGAFYGCQALLQLLPPAVYRRGLVRGIAWSVPAVDVRDKPMYRWRGVMLDVARHFVPKQDVLRFIDLLAMHRLNVLHLHLTDDQGWRVEILRYPRLTTHGAGRRESQVGAGAGAPSDGRPHGGFYSQDDIREIVAYAAARFITVVPEIDSPGHVQAAIAAYPELGITGESLDVHTRWVINPNVLRINEATIEFFTNVLDEVMDLFPSPYIGIGGDEAVKDQWKTDAATQALIADLNLPDEEALQSWYLHRLGAHVSARGRRLFGWDEILDGDLPPDTIVASWHGMAGAVTAARAGHDVVSSPDDLVYLDYRQSSSPDEPIPHGFPVSAREVYDFDPVPPGLTDDEAAHILGGQANLWTEHIDSPRMLDYYAFPRVCALAEALWTSGERDYAEFELRLTVHLQRLDAIGVEYRQAGGPLLWQTRPGIPGHSFGRRKEPQED